MDTVSLADRLRKLESRIIADHAAFVEHRGDMERALANMAREQKISDGQQQQLRRNCNARRLQELEQDVSQSSEFVQKIAEKQLEVEGRSEIRLHALESLISQYQSHVDCRVRALQKNVHRFDVRLHRLSQRLDTECTSAKGESFPCKCRDQENMSSSIQPLRPITPLINTQMDHLSSSSHPEHAYRCTYSTGQAFHNANAGEVPTWAQAWQETMLETMSAKAEEVMHALSVARVRLDDIGKPCADKVTSELKEELTAEIRSVREEAYQWASQEEVHEILMSEAAVRSDTVHKAEQAAIHEALEVTRAHHTSEDVQSVWHGALADIRKDACAIISEINAAAKAATLEIEEVGRTQICASTARNEIHTSTGWDPTLSCSTSASSATEAMAADSGTSTVVTPMKRLAIQQELLEAAVSLKQVSAETCQAHVEVQESIQHEGAQCMEALVAQQQLLAKELAQVEQRVSARLQDRRFLVHEPGAIHNASASRGAQCIRTGSSVTWASSPISSKIASCMSIRGL